MNADKMLSDRERREAAQASAGIGVEPGAREVRPREIRQMVSVRMEPELVRELRAIADSQGLKVSDLLRSAAANLVSEHARQQVAVRLVPSTDSTTVPLRIAYRYWDGHAARGTGEPSVGLGSAAITGA